MKKLYENYLEFLNEDVGKFNPTNRPFDVRNIEKESIDNNFFRHVLFTAKNIQLVVMSLNPKEDIGEETHDNVDQFFRVEEGEGVSVLNGKENKLTGGSSIVVPMGIKHNIINTSSNKKLKLYTIYSPPHHSDGLIHKTKKQAEIEGD